MGTDRLFLNQGGRGFLDVTAGIPTDDGDERRPTGLRGARWSTSCALLDYDGDALLDLVVINYLAFHLEEVRGPGAGCTWKGHDVMCGPEGVILAVDVLKCTRCDSWRRWIAVITEPDAIHRLLEHLGLQSAAPRRRRPGGLGNSNRRGRVAGAGAGGLRGIAPWGRVPGGLERPRGARRYWRCLTEHGAKRAGRGVHGPEAGSGVGDPKLAVTYWSACALSMRLRETR